MAMVTPYTVPVIGGVTTFVRELGAALQARGVEVTVISRNGNQAEGVEVINARPIAFAYQAAKLIRKLSPDAVHAHGHWYTLQAGVAACRKSGSRLVFTFHTAPKPQGPIRRRAFLELLSRCNYITFPSSYLRDRIGIKLPVEKTLVIHPGGCRGAGPAGRSLLKGSAEREGEDFVTIGYVGKFEWPAKVRGFEILLRAMRLLASRGVRLVVAGGGSLLPEVRKTIGQLDLTNRVELLGELADPKHIYRICDIYCHPSLQEGMSLAVLEAMAEGLPIVAIKEGFMAEAVRNGVDGFLVNPDPVPLAEALAELIDHPGLARTMGINAQSHARQEFNWENIAGQFENLYEAHT